MQLSSSEALMWPLQVWHSIVSPEAQNTGSKNSSPDISLRHVVDCPHILQHRMVWKLLLTRRYCSMVTSALKTWIEWIPIFDTYICRCRSRPPTQQTEFMTHNHNQQQFSQYLHCHSEYLSKLKCGLRCVVFQVVVVLALTQATNVRNKTIEKQESSACETK